jgi:hypothetical protein
MTNLTTKEIRISLKKLTPQVWTFSGEKRNAA